MTRTSILGAAAATAFCFAVGTALCGCAGRETARTDGFPSGWELQEGAPAARTASRKPAPVQGGFPKGWELPSASAASASAVSASAVSATTASGSELAKAEFQTAKAEHLLERLRSTGYQVLVEEDLKAIEALREDARKALAAGDAALAGRIADDMGLRLQKAKTRIEAETQQPLRW